MEVFAESNDREVTRPLQWKGGARTVNERGSRWEILCDIGIIEEKKKRCVAVGAAFELDKDTRKSLANKRQYAVRSQGEVHLSDPKW